MHAVRSPQPLSRRVSSALPVLSSCRRFYDNVESAQAAIEGLLALDIHSGSAQARKALQADGRDPASLTTEERQRIVLNTQQVGREFGVYFDNLRVRCRVKLAGSRGTADAPADAPAETHIAVLSIAPSRDGRSMSKV